MVLEIVVDFWALTSTLAYTEGGRVKRLPQGEYLSEAIVLAMLASHHHMAECTAYILKHIPRYYSNGVYTAAERSSLGEGNYAYCFSCLVDCTLHTLNTTFSMFSHIYATLSKMYILKYMYTYIYIYIYRPSHDIQIL